MPEDVITGLHILGELTGVAHEFIDKAEVTWEKVIAHVKSQEVQVLHEYHYQFSSGYTAVLCLAESHVAIHTWPEHGYVTLDVYLCNYERDNTEKTERIFQGIVDIFAPGKAKVTRIKR